MTSSVDKMLSLDRDQAQSLLKALSDPLRLRILDKLSTGERCVCDLTEA